MSREDISYISCLNRLGLLRLTLKDRKLKCGIIMGDEVITTIPCPKCNSEMIYITDYNIAQCSNCNIIKSVFSYKNLETDYLEKLK